MQALHNSVAADQLHIRSFGSGFYLTFATGSALSRSTKSLLERILKQLHDTFLRKANVFYFENS